MTHRVPHLLLLLIALAPSLLLAETRRVALVVGNNDGGASVQELRHAESDADKFYDVLVDIGGFRPADIVLLTGETSDALRTAFDTLEGRVASYQGSADHVVLVFYYSGHAEPEHLQLGSTRFPLSELRARLQSSRAQMRLGILDACHSGAILRDKGGRRAHEPLQVEDNIESNGYAILTSSSASEASQESDELRGAFFTHYVVSGLRGDADYSGDRRVTLGELYQYAYHATVSRSQGTRAGPQHPHFEAAQSGDLVLSQLQRAPGLITFPPDVHGDFLVFDPDANVVLAELSKTVGSRRSLAVRTGQLEIYDRSGGGLRRAVIDVGENEEIVIVPDAMENVEVASYALRGPAFGVALSASFGAQMFYDDAFTAGYVKDTLLYGLDLRLQNLGVAGLDLGIESMFTVTNQSIALAAGDADQSLFEATIAATVWYRFQIDDFHVALGPRVAWVLFRRHVEAPTVVPEIGTAEKPVVGAGDAVQYYSTFTPGAAVEIGYRIVQPLTVAATVHGSYLHFEADGTSNDLLTMNYLFRLQYNF